MRKKQTLEKFIDLEKAVMKAFKAVIVAHAMELMEYFFDLMRIKKLSEVCAKLKRNYYPTGPTTYNDRGTFIQLNMDVFFLQCKVIFWKIDQQLFQNVDISSSKYAKDSVNTTSQENEQASIEEESVPVHVQSKLIPSVKAKVLLAHEPTEEVSLANVDGFFKSVTEEIQDQILIEEQAQLEQSIVEKSDGDGIPIVQVSIPQTEMYIQ